jgi:hypothetical protein
LFLSFLKKPIAYSIQPKAAAVEQPKAKQQGTLFLSFQKKAYRLQHTAYSSRCGAAEGKAAGYFVKGIRDKRRKAGKAEAVAAE